jgi:glutathione S-transferase
MCATEVLRTCSIAILQHLARYHDPEHKLSFTEPADIAKFDQWIHFMQGDITPNGTNNVRFFRFFPVKQSFSIALFHREGLKTLEVLDKALEGRDYLVGAGRGKYSFADIANFTFVNNSHFTGLGSLEGYKNLYAWQQRIWAREAVKTGVNTPYPAISVNEIIEKKVKEDPEFAANEEKLKAALKKALDENPPLGPPPPHKP